MKLHLALHGQTSQCPECGKKYARAASLKAHIMLHIEEDTLTCNVCDNEFETMGSLKRHQVTEHNTTKNLNVTLTQINTKPPPEPIEPNSKSFSCKECTASFDNQRDLKEHNKIHQKVNQLYSRVMLSVL